MFCYTGMLYNIIGMVERPSLLTCVAPPVLESKQWSKRKAREAFTSSRSTTSPPSPMLTHERWLCCCSCRNDQGHIQL